MRSIHLLTLLLAAPLLAQPDNGGFESTIETPEGGLTAEHWTMVSEFGGGLVDQAHTGTYALGVWTWYWYAEGLASNGTSVTPEHDGMPVSGSPTQLTGWYRRDEGLLQEGEQNQALIHVILTRWNPLSTQRDTVAMGTRLFGEQVEWAPFTVDIDYTSAVAPDTVVIQLLSCGNCLCEGPSQGYCAYFTVDDLALSFPQGFTEDLLKEETVRLIGQSDGTLRIHVQENTPLPLQLQLWDARGRAVADVQVRRDGQVVAVPNGSGLLAYRAGVGGRAVGSGRVMR